jgi:eukaryotic-like serine/threonine-protein kinase
MIGEYVLERSLGDGGFAKIYAARGPDGRRVAIKVLLAEHIGSTAVARFAREVAIVRRLRHPSIIDIVRAGTLPDGRPYCVMELLAGRDLGHVLEAGPLPVPRVIEIVAQVADALAAAHAADVVHRDVKASNVFLCDDGRIVLLDFGIAKLALAGGLTLSREAIGTIGSMAPEQLTARPVDARTDIYALGALLFELVTGGPPFRARDTSTQIQLHRFAQRPRASEHGAPESIDPVIAKAMAIRPSDRYASATELADAVRVALGAARRTRSRAVGVHLEALDELDALHEATAALRDHGFRPLSAGIAGGAWWRDLAAVDRAPFDRTVRRIVERGVAVTVHVDELDIDSGHAAGGPLSELWRWVPSAALSPLVLTPDAVKMLALPEP